MTAIASEHDIEWFIERFVAELRANSAAVFVGAGMSIDAGYVSWLDLLAPIARELGLDVAEEKHDLVALAQFSVNANCGNRSEINRAILDQLLRSAKPTKNHELLAALPLQVFWTTNYDTLIEDALKEAERVPDVKHSVKQLASTRSGRDAVVYKMHGDASLPAEAVLTKDDYERYHVERGAFVTALAGDLVERTFLFLGLSFTDPNIDYVLSRVRSTFAVNQRRHFCLMRAVTKETGEASEIFERRTRRQQLAIEDLRRFNITTLLLEDYAEITEILERIERTYRSRTIFVSGSAVDYSPFDRRTAELSIRALGAALVANGYRVVTGVGLGVGNALISGVIDETLEERQAHLEDVLVMRPFPYVDEDHPKRSAIWDRYRRGMIKRAGVFIALFGNRSEAGQVIVADGVQKEAEIAAELGLRLLPVGATGYAAGALAQSLLDSPRIADRERTTLELLQRPLGSPDDLSERILVALDTPWEV